MADLAPTAEAVGQVIKHCPVCSAFYDEATALWRYGHKLHALWSDYKLATKEEVCPACDQGPNCGHVSVRGWSTVRRGWSMSGDLTVWHV